MNAPQLVRGGSVCREDEKCLEGSPSLEGEKREERFNLAVGGTAALRVSHTCTHTRAHMHACARALSKSARARMWTAKEIHKEARTLAFAQTETGTHG